MDFEEHLKLTVTEIRAKLAEAGIGHMYFNITASGRTEAGDVNVTFYVAPNNVSDMPLGGNLSAVVDEAIRRDGWKARNASLCLPSA